MQGVTIWSVQTSEEISLCFQIWSQVLVYKHWQLTNKSGGESTGYQTLPCLQRLMQQPIETVDVPVANDKFVKFLSRIMKGERGGSTAEKGCSDKTWNVLRELAEVRINSKLQTEHLSWKSEPMPAEFISAEYHQGSCRNRWRVFEYDVPVTWSSDPFPMGIPVQRCTAIYKMHS